MTSFQPFRADFGYCNVDEQAERIVSCDATGHCYLYLQFYLIVLMFLLARNLS